MNHTIAQMVSRTLAPCRSASRRRPGVLGLGIMALLAAASLEAQIVLPAGERQAVAATRWFRFYSDSLFSLHDYLNWRTSGLPTAPTESCPARLTDTDQRAFDRAQQFYASMRGRDHERFLIAIRYELAGYPDLDIVPDSVIARAEDVLKPALSAYLACWWRSHDQRNRGWIAQLIPRLRAHEDSIAARLARVYQAEWEGQMPVDVVSFATATGANAVGDPDHINISSADSSYNGDSALEMVFHEASHTIVDSGRDIIRKALQDSTVTRGVAAPRELSHVLLFYSVGKITSARLAETGSRGYEPYLYREGLFERAWPQFRRPVEQHWQPYLDGTASAGDAIRELVRELSRSR